MGLESAAKVPDASDAGRLSSQQPEVELCLLGGWRLQSGVHQIRLAPSPQRLLARVGLAGRMNRTLLAGTLWPEATERHARASLRSTLWRLQRAVPDVVVEDADDLAIVRDVRLDVAEMTDIARSVLLGRPAPPELALQLLHYGELLPGWYDDWVLVERERLHELRLHALEALAAVFTRAGRHAHAVDAALAAVAADPLRESARRAVIQAYLGEGNYGAALRHFTQYRALLRQELDLEPSPSMLMLMRGVRQQAGYATSRPRRPR